MLVAFSGPPINLSGGTLVLLLAYFVIFIPQGLQVTGAVRSQLGADPIDASRTCGAGLLRTMRRVVVPLTAPATLGGSLFLFVLIAGEVNASIVLAGPTNQVVGPQLFNLWNEGSFGLVTALAVALTVVNGVVVVVGRRLSKVQLR
jgi:iron(III) transport system permease protein